MASPEKPTLEQQIQSEQVGMLYRQLPVSVAGTMVGASILVAVLWGEAHGPALFTWFALMLANQMWRLLLYVRFRRRGMPMQSVAHAGRVWAIGSGISGVLWGSTAVLFFTPQAELHQAIVAILVFGVAAGAVPLIASHSPSFFAFVLPALLPFAVQHLLVGGGGHVALALILLAVTLGIVSFGRNYNRLLLAALKNRFENEAMARDLARQNADLDAARKVAEQASRAKTQFFAAASHDLRQPLHAMGLFAAALFEKVRDPGVRDVIESINASVQALEALFNELLDISKIDAGIIKPEPTHFALEAVLHRLRDEFRAEAAAKGLKLTIRSEGQTVLSDVVLLERILRNLVSNAIRYTDTGEITVAASTSDGAVRIEVADTGAGIRPEDQQRIFEEFVQLANPGRTSKKGLGLGLSIVKRLCDLLGYRIRLVSEHGKGSAFSFDVPLGVEPPRVAPARREPSRTDLSGVLVVVIDDEAAVVNGMKVLLSSWGAEVIASLTGEDVVDAVHAKGKLPNLIIADYRLAGHDTGLDVIDRLREALDPEIPAVVVTGSTAPETTAAIAERGLGVLLKPVLPARLREVVEANM